MKHPSREVYFFSTCLIDSFYPFFGMDAAALLELSGYELRVPNTQTCCGQPPFNSGYIDQAIPVVMNNLNIFAGDDIPLLVPSASCAAMIKHHYLTLFSESSPEYQRVLHLSRKTYELLDFLLEALPYSELVNSSNTTVALHQSCSSLREMKVSDSWERILNKLDHVTVVKPKYAEECCGFGGTFSVKSPQISKAMSEDKCKHLAETKADIIVTGDTGCLMNIEGTYKKQSDQQKITHIVSFLAEQFGVSNDR